MSFKGKKKEIPWKGFPPGFFQVVNILVIHKFYNQTEAKRLFYIYTSLRLFLEIDSCLSSIVPSDFYFLY